MTSAALGFVGPGMSGPGTSGHGRSGPSVDELIQSRDKLNNETHCVFDYTNVSNIFDKNAVNKKTPLRLFQMNRMIIWYFFIVAFKSSTYKFMDISTKQAYRICLLEFIPLIDALLINNDKFIIHNNKIQNHLYTKPKNLYNNTPTMQIPTIENGLRGVFMNVCYRDIDDRDYTLSKSIFREIVGIKNIPTVFLQLINCEYYNIRAKAEILVHEYNIKQNEKEVFEDAKIQYYVDTMSKLLGDYTRHVYIDDRDSGQYTKKATHKATVTYTEYTNIPTFTFTKSGLDKDNIKQLQKRYFENQDSFKMTRDDYNDQTKITGSPIMVKTTINGATTNFDLKTELKIYENIFEIYSVIHKDLSNILDKLTQDQIDQINEFIDLYDLNYNTYKSIFDKYEKKFVNDLNTFDTNMVRGMFNDKRRISIDYIYCANLVISYKNKRICEEMQRIFDYFLDDKTRIKYNGIKTPVSQSSNVNKQNSTNKTSGSFINFPKVNFNLLNRTNKMSTPKGGRSRKHRNAQNKHKSKNKRRVAYPQKTRRRNPRKHTNANKYLA
jgi:hypothetical protein